MFNIRRYDPTQPVASTSNAPIVTDIALKIDERRRKRTAGDAGLLTPASPQSAPAQDREVAQNVRPAEEDYGGWKPAPGESPAEREKRLKKEKRAAKLGLPPPSAAAPALPRASERPVVSSHVAEWQPAPGESPAEREKRIKREKRAAKFGGDSPAASGSLQASHAHPSPPNPVVDAVPDTGLTAAAGGIHPSRVAAAPLLAREVKLAGPPKEKTPAKKNYLKKKKERAKGKRAGEPLARKAVKRVKPDDDQGGGDDDDDDNDDDHSAAGGDEGVNGEVRPAWQNDETKRAEIMAKKAERKLKRDARKAEQKRLKAQGGDAPPPPAPRVVRSLAEGASPSRPADTVASTHVETAESLEAAAERAALDARKEAKRQKRAARRLSPPPPNLAADLVASPEPVMNADVNSGSRLSPPVPNADHSSEPAPLLRLPGATRPAPPSAQALSALTVHESVRDKVVVDPDLKVPFSDERMDISERGRARLQAMGIDKAFAVQTEVIPLLLPKGTKPSLYSPSVPYRDLCVSAPTGSGKTLSYVVPIVETLSSRVVTRLRAIVLLPTRDLVAQVQRTFETYGKGAGLKIGSVTGQHSFAHEQGVIVGDLASSDIKGGLSQVDILIATPGRLIDHLRSTAGFTLQHLRFLVIDEADRLLTQSFHNWLPSVLSALKPSDEPLNEPSAFSTIPDPLAPAWWDKTIGATLSDVREPCRPSCQKLLFSATLSRDPANIAALQLHHPVYVSVEDELTARLDDQGVDGNLKFTLPSTLSESMIFSPSTHKPLYLFHLLRTLPISSALCFTKSVEAATRLAKLIEFFEAQRPVESDRAPVVVKAYSSDLSAGERTSILADFKKGRITMLICSDLIARGIDLPDVSHVISYDMPSDMRKYVHRVGRTARAGRTGSAWSLVEDQEAAPFRKMMKDAGHWEAIQRMRVKDAAVEPFINDYQVALDKLRAHFAVRGETVAL